MRLIDVDKIDWQKGVFVNPSTDEPLPIIHKIATIEMLRDWQEEVKAIPIDKVKKAREKIANISIKTSTDCEGYEEVETEEVLNILDKLIESGEK